MANFESVLDGVKGRAAANRDSPAITAAFARAGLAEYPAPGDRGGVGVESEFHDGLRCVVSQHSRSRLVGASRHVTHSVDRDSDGAFDRGAQLSGFVAVLQANECSGNRCPHD